MIASTLRRAACCPARSCVSPSASNPPVAATQSLLASRCHQRRHSSSKPPAPPNDRSTTISNSVKTVSPRQSKGDASKSKSDKRPGAESRLTKHKNPEEGGLEERPLNLPTVPSTNHLHPQDVSVAAFFAFHRPISITSSIPAALTQDDFSSIFASKPKSKNRPPRVVDVVYTVSSAIQGLEEVINQQSQHETPTQNSQNALRRQDANQLLDSVSQSSPNIAQPEQTQHLDGEPNNIGSEGQGLRVSLDQLAQQFRPFRPPPPPVPMLNVRLDAEAEENSHSQQPLDDDEAVVRQELREQQQSNKGEEEAIYQSLVTMKEKMSKNGTKYFTAHATPLVRVSEARRRMPANARTTQNQMNGLPEDGSTGNVINSSSPYLDRRLRNLRLLQDSDAVSMYAISVRRQRKLKMKKHKHKKLLRRTRNLRRKLDKL